MSSEASKMDKLSDDNMGTSVRAMINGGLLKISADAPKTLAETLQRAAKQYSQQGITYIDLDGSESTQYYENLLQEAQQILSGLRKLGFKPQDKVIFQLERNQDFIAAFWGCILGGFVPVPISIAPTYELPNSTIIKLKNTWQMLGKPLILAGAKLAYGLRSLSELLKLESFQVQVIDDLRQCEPDTHWHPSQPDDLAILLLTSGSTGIPKAVMQSHRALLSRSSATAQMNKCTSDDISVNWFPLEHVVGLAMFHIRDVYLGCQQIHAPKELVLQQPLRWLDWIDRYQATITWGPNFAYGLINERAEELNQRNWNLSSMRFIINGGEAIVAKQARTFLKLLEPFGLSPNTMYPAWGMSEVCSGINFNHKFSLDSSTDKDSFVSVGKPLPGVSLRIANENMEVISEGEIGLLQVKGLIVTSGYYQNYEANQEAFTKDGWFNTGDLAFIKDGCLTITGRQTDIIIVNGINYYSHEIEAVVEELPGIEASYTAACPVFDKNGSTDRLAIFFNTAKTIEGGLLQLIKEIRSHVVKSIGINPDYLIPVEKEVIPKTSIGKIQRKQLKHRFETGEFEEFVAQISMELANFKAQEFVSGNALERDVAKIWQKVLKIPEVGIHDNFFELGGHSLLLAQVHIKLQELFDTTLSVVDLFKYPTIHTLVEYLTQNATSESVSQQGKARAKLRTAAVKHPNVAVIGMACRFPEAENISQFWQNLCDGIESISFFSKEEVLSEGIHKQRVENPNYVKAAPILEKIEDFDANFFGYSTREAMILDPQQRLFLECAWEAIEDSGYDANTYQGSIGMYAGAGLNTYLLHNVFPNRNQFNAEDGSNVMTQYSMGGFQILIANDKDFLPTRVSYKLNLKGPSINVQTACSTSLVAIHTAYQSVVSGECDMALAGGVSVTLPQKAGYLYEDGMILSPDGHCRAFDAKAQGTIFGNGAGIVLLKRLDEAIADGDRIYCVIKGSTINNDGAMKVGYSATSQEGQATTVAESIALAGINAETITYFETHGTGTAMGDPIEIAAMTQGFRSTTDRSGFCAIGSVKTNVGHLQIASGVAGFIKTALALKHKKIPPSLHFEQPNPLIDFANSPFYVNTELRDWETGGIPRRAGVKSLGIGGTNACLILEEAPIQVQTSKSKVQSKKYQERPVHLLTLSAKTQKALEDLVSRYQHHLQSDIDLEIPDICYTANTGRTHFKHRLAIVISDQQELADKLVKISTLEKVNGIFSGELPANNQSPKIAFLFTGQGSQYVNMGIQLYETQSVFRQTLDQCNLILQPYLNKSILDIIYPDLGNSDDISLINQTAYTQPALFAIEYALAQLWESWGIKPDVVMGHSVGEYVAATVAGIFSLEDGLKLIAHRGRLMQQLPNGGEMVSVMASEEKVNQVIAPYQEKVVIAAINGPESIVISGESEALGKVQEILASEKIKTKQLQVSHAFHSPLMEPMLADFKAVANQITYNQPQVTLISNVTGSRAGESITTANYWVNHVRQPVKFAPSMKTLHQEGYEVFLEIGSKPILLGMGRQCLPEGIGAWLPSLRPSQEDWQQMLHSLAALYVRGFKVNWLGFDRYYVRSKVVLPTYPFQRQRYWIETSENVSKKAEPSSESKTTTIVDWLNDGNTQQLAQQLEKAGKFSPEQIKLLPEVLETLVKQHQEELTAVTIKDWFYQVQWKPLPESQPKTNIKPGHWLIFVDSTGVGEKLAEQWQQQGGECSLVYRGERYQKNESRAYELNPTEPQEFEQLIKSLRERSNLPLQRVIHLWSLDTPITKDLTVTSLESAQRWGCGTVLHLIKALSKTNNIAQLWLVTRGAQSVQSQTEEVSVAASSLWGMGRVISLEHPELWSRMVDLDLLSPESEIETLFEIIVDNNQPEDHLALRGEHTYIARLVKQSPTDSQPILLESNATYLITGGLGALGLHTAKCLVEKGAKHLVLTGRRQSSAFAQQTIEELQKVGVQVLVLRGDISQEEDTTNILDEIKTSLPPLRGVIHAAGLLDDGLLQNMTWEQFTQVMAPKIQGSWHLHNLTQNLSLDFFVCFSSIASLMGSLGQGNYAAANAFMDALVQHRQWMGLPGLSINWGPWAQVGMTANLSSRHQARMVTKGINTLDSEQGLQILGQLLGQSLPQVGVLSVEWSVFQKQFSFGNQMPLLLELVKLTESQEKAKPKATKQYDLLENLKSVPEADRYDLLRTHIQSEVAQILGIKDLQLLTPEQNLLNIGLDSLCAIELKTRLNSLGVKVSLETIQQGTSISELAQECVTQIKKNPLILNEQINLQQKQSRDIQKLSPSQDKKSPNNPMKASVGFETSNPWLVVLRANPDAPMKLICFPYAGAGPVMYSRWFEDLSANVEVYAVQLPGRAARLKEKPIAHMDRVVEELTPSLVSCIKDKPFAFFGHCIGALQMFEVTHQLQKDHCLHPDHMFVSGARAPQYYNQVQLEIDHQQWLSHNQTTHKSQEEKFLDLLRALNFTSSQVLFDDEEMRQLMLPTVQADFRINDTYISTPKPPLEIPITAIGGQTDPFVSGQHLLGWKEHTTQDFTANFIPGDHYFIEKQRYYLTQLVSEKLNYSQLK